MAGSHRPTTDENALITTRNKGWTIDELALAGPEHLDAGYVAAYDLKAGVDWTQEVERLRELGLAPSKTLVDLGTGTGGLALAAAHLAGRIVAVDISAPMLAEVRKRAHELGVTNVECVQAGLLTYAHDGQPADMVYCRHVLHHLPDFWKALALKRAASILQRGGFLLLRDLVFSSSLETVEDRIDNWLAEASTQPGIGWSRNELVTHLRDEYSTFSWLLEPMLEQAGFEIQQVEFSASQIFADYVCVRRQDEL
jgi:ubiquinone/menaquinone biosynthesis C-methylase UbiE